MKQIFPILLLSVVLGLSGGSNAQEGAAKPLADASQVEEVRRLAGQVADLEEAYAAQGRRVANLVSELESMRAALREAQENQSRKLVDMATRDDLKKMAESIQEVDKRREADKKTILEAIEKMGRELTRVPVPTFVPPPADKPDKTTKTPDKIKDDKPPKDLSKTSTNANNELVYTHTVARNENLSVIIAAYNAALKEQNKANITLESVKKANPKININNLYVGQEILIPVPPDKK